MSHYVAFLRGMNLGGRRLTNDELCAAFGRLGFGDAAAFLASGNVVFAAEGDLETVTERLETGLEEVLGYPVPTFLRTGQALRALAASDPFGQRPGAEQRPKPQIAFLREEPSSEAAEQALALATDDDWLALEGAHLHWLPRAGVSGSDLDFRALERALGPTTTRTRNTVQRLVKKFLR